MLQKDIFITSLASTKTKVFRICKATCEHASPLILCICSLLHKWWYQGQFAFGDQGWLIVSKDILMGYTLMTLFSVHVLLSGHSEWGVVSDMWGIANENKDLKDLVDVKHNVCCYSDMVLSKCWIYFQEWLAYITWMSTGPPDELNFPK